MVTETRPKVKLLFEPINVQQDGFIASQADRLLFSGAFGAGKSIVLCAKGLKLSLDYPDNLGLIARKVRATLTQTTLKTFTDLVCPKELILDFNKTEGLITLINKSQLLFGGLDDPLKLGSLNLGWAGIDEAIETEEDDWKMLEGRLRLRDVPHQIFAATNPGPMEHYLYRMFFTEKRGEVYQASSLENPELPADYRKRLEEFEGTYHQRYVLGLWVGMEGLVYSGFDEQGCVVKRMEIPKNWPVYAGHDFGDANPAAIFYALNPGTGEYWAFAEYLPKDGPSVYEQVQAFKKITEGYNVMKRIGGSHQEGAVRQAYTSQGWHIMEPNPEMTNKPKAQRIRVQQMHKFNKIMVFSDMANYIREKLSMAFKKDGSTLTDEIEHESRFHLMAAERYILSDFTPETAESKQELQVWRY